MIDLSKLTNPVWRRDDNLRDPSVLRTDGGYMLFYTRYSNSAPGQGGCWGKAENWSVGMVFTRDFVHFERDRDLSPKGFASPGDPTWWHGRWVLPYQVYPVQPNRLCFSESIDGRAWGEPRYFLDDARLLPWNKDQRLIDPTFMVHEGVLHCWFVGSEGLMSGTNRANFLGHATTRDSDLREWTIHTVDRPLMGRDRAPDGVENVSVFRAGDRWIMIYSEGLAEQHLAYATSKDLMSWTFGGVIELETQPWMRHRHGAPFVWEEDGRYLMLLMGEENAQHRSTLGLVVSDDGVKWRVLPPGV